MLQGVDTLTHELKAVINKYHTEYPDVRMGKDYFPLKIAEEWGECLQAYLMLTDRGRQKSKTKDEIRDMLSEELADVFAYLFLFADSQEIDISTAISQKWLSYLKKGGRNK